MVRGRQAGVVRDFQSTPTVQQKLGTVGGADSSRASGAPTPHTHTHKQKIPTAKTNACTRSGVVHVCGGAGMDIERRGEAQWGNKKRKEGRG